MKSTLRRAFAALVVWLIFPPVGLTQETPSPAVQSRFAGLRAEIAHHDELYFKKAAPEISDAEYDRLKRELRDLEARYPALAAEAARSASARGVGDDRTGQFPTQPHRERMLSLDKAYTEAEVRAFVTRVGRLTGRRDLSFVIEPKFDGLALSATYERGVLVRAVTRGNGVEGDDVTANVRTIKALPQELRALRPDGTHNVIPELVELRGEVYVDYPEFARLNAAREAAGEEPFAHPRNLAAGTLKSLDPEVVATRRLSVVFYGWGAWERAETQPASQQALHEMIRAWGLPGVTRVRVAPDAEAVWAAIQSAGRERPGLPFPTDGAVVKLDDVALQRLCGASEEAPRWAIAYKFPPERVATRLRAITLQVGRTGALTPVAELEPARLGGTTITRASLHNAAEIARRDLRVGDMVFLEKAGEIIPAITGVDSARRPSDAAPFVFPTHCPECATLAVREAGAAVTRCPNPDCPAQVRRRLLHYASREAVGIDGLGEVAVAALVRAGKVRSVADLYQMRRADLAAAGLGEGNAAGRLLAAIEASKRAEPWRVVYGLGIPQVGAQTARVLVARFGGLPEMLAARREDWLTEGRSVVSGVSAGTAETVWMFFAREENRAVVALLLEHGVGRGKVRGADAVPTGPLSGKVFVLTGTLPTLSRAEAAARIVAAGGQVGAGVSRRTDFVVAGKSAGAKLGEAQQLGVRIIDEAELLRLLAQTP